jgi:hypothetical protein
MAGQKADQMDNMTAAQTVHLLADLSAASMAE